MMALSMFITAILYAILLAIMIYELLGDIIDFTSLTIADEDGVLFLFIALLMLPLIFVLNWRQLTFMSFVSVSSIAALFVAVFYTLILCAVELGSFPVPSSFFADEGSSVNVAATAIDEMSVAIRIAFSFMIFKSGMNGAGCIPPLVLGLADKSERNLRCVFAVSYALVLAVSLLFGVMGAMVYGDEVNILVLNNLFYWPSDAVAAIVAAITIVNLIGSLSFWVSVAAKEAELVLRVREGETWKRYLVRVLFVAAFLVVAYLVRADLSFMTCLAAVYVLIAWLAGSALLYLKLFWHELSVASRALNSSLVLITAVLVTATVYGASQGLIA